MRALCFGSLNIDKVYAVPHMVQPGETLASESLRVNCGGKGLNQSIAQARAGVSVIHRGLLPEESLRLAARAASIAVARHGASVSIPTLSEVEAALSGVGPSFAQA